MTSLSDEFAATTVEDWLRTHTSVPRPEHPTIPEVDEKAILERLGDLHFDLFESDPLRYPRCPPTPYEWKQHLDSIEQSGSYLEERTFEADTWSMVEAASAEAACQNDKACIAYSCWRKIIGLDRPIVLQRLPRPHAPICLLCHRYQFHDLLVQDRKNRELLNTPSSVSRPGSIAYVHRRVRPVQSFYNMRDVPGQYSSKFMILGEENDIVVLPMARLLLSDLRAVHHPVGSGLYRIDQSKMMYREEEGTRVVPGETVERFKERVRQYTEEEKEEEIEWE